MKCELKWVPHHIIKEQILMKYIIQNYQDNVYQYQKDTSISPIILQHIIHCIYFGSNQLNVLKHC